MIASHIPIQAQAGPADIVAAAVRAPGGGTRAGGCPVVYR